MKNYAIGKIWKTEYIMENSCTDSDLKNGDGKIAVKLSPRTENIKKIDMEDIELYSKISLDENEKMKTRHDMNPIIYGTPDRLL